MTTTQPVVVVTVQGKALTHELLARAFEAWELGFRASPQNFLSAEECAALGVSQLSSDRGDYLLSLLNELVKEA